MEAEDIHLQQTVIEVAGAVAVELLGDLTIVVCVVIDTHIL